MSETVTVVVISSAALRRYDQTLIDFGEPYVAAYYGMVWLGWQEQNNQYKP